MRDGAAVGLWGRAWIGRTFALSLTKGGKSALQTSPLYAQVPSKYKAAVSLELPCSNRKYSVSPSAQQPK